MTCDGSATSGDVQNANAVLASSGSTGAKATSQAIGKTLVFDCKSGFQTGTVTYTCAQSGSFTTSDTCTGAAPACVVAYTYVLE